VPAPSMPRGPARRPLALLPLAARSPFFRSPPMSRVLNRKRSSCGECPPLQQSCNIRGKKAARRHPQRTRGRRRLGQCVGRRRPWSRPTRRRSYFPTWCKIATCLCTPWRAMDTASARFRTRRSTVRAPGSLLLRAAMWCCAAAAAAAARGGVQQSYHRDSLP